MLNKILAKLNGESGDPAALSAQLAQIERDRITARDDIAAAEQKRHQALLDDADDKTIDKLDREIERAALRLERLTAAVQPLNDRLTAAKVAASRRALDRHFDVMSERYENLKAAVLAADEAQFLWMNSRDAAIAECGEHAVNRTIPIFAFGGLLGHGFAATWAAENDRHIAAARQVLRAPKTAVAPARKPSAAGAPSRGVERSPVSQHAVSLADQPTAPKSRQARMVDTAPLGPDEIRVRVLRSGYCDGDGLQRAAGDVIRLNRRVAEMAANNAAVAFIDDAAKQGAES